MILVVEVADGSVEVDRTVVPVLVLSVDPDVAVLAVVDSVDPEVNVTVVSLVLDSGVREVVRPVVLLVVDVSVEAAVVLCVEAELDPVVLA